jgi:thiamine biosynthesis lipoprotein
MATTVNLQVLDPGPDAEQALASAQEVFYRVEAACTRFDPGSPLMRANAAGEDWHVVPRECFDAIREAARAHHETGGVFDPRVHDSLVALGYDRSLPFGTGPVDLPRAPALTRVPATAGSQHTDRRDGWDSWEPGLDEDRLAVRIGPRRIDLGGIGKGLAVRWASQVLAGAGAGHLITAGGDCYLAGAGPLGTGWRVGVEDPASDQDGADPLAVLELTDLGCATSSLKKRTWRAGGQVVHHLIDPRTGRSTGGQVRAVTVAGPDTATAEVWSKSLLIRGQDGPDAIASLARTHMLAALWVDSDGRVQVSDQLRPHLIWQAWA